MPNRARTRRTNLAHALPLLAAAMLGAAAWAGPPPAAELSNPAITAAEITAHVKYLASDELKGRRSGSPENDKASDYIAGRFKAVGLKPAGEGHSYFQKFSVFTGLKLGEGNNLAIASGGSPGTPLKVQSDFMPLAFTKNAAVDAPIVFAGYGISQPELGYDDYAGVDVKGKVVIILRYTPDGDPNGKFGPYAALTYKTMTARDKGAAGILLATGPMGDRPETLGVFDMDSATSDCGVPAAFLKREQVDRLLVKLGTNLADVQVGIAHGKPNSFGIEGARATMRMHVDREMKPTRNVLGLIEGSDPQLKNELVVVGAHYDHLGMGGSHSLDASGIPAIHHGADDNASGTAGVLELAQYFAANRKKLGRSVLFMCFSGEEIGLLGSEHWVKNPTLPIKRVAAMINLDMIGRSKNDVFYVVGTGTSTAWPKLLEEVNAPLKLQAKLGDKDGFGGSDHQSFYGAGIPVLFFFTGVHSDYHRPSDTWEKINSVGEAKVLEYVASAVAKTTWLGSRPDFVKSKSVEPSAGPGGFRVYLGTVPDYGAEVEGVAIADVRPGGPADKGGIKPGDVLVEFDGKSVRNVQEYTVVLSTAKPNVPIKLVVLRKGQRVTLDVTPAAGRG